MAKRNKKNRHIYSMYYAPRGRVRIFDLAIQLSQQYLSPFDRLIGVMGEAGSGKSVLVKGMFPGLELTNDDDGVNVRPLPILDLDNNSGFFTPHTYHVDVRFEMGFSQLHMIAAAILDAMKLGKRVVVEHFDLIYKELGVNADILIGIGEEVIITRPNIFGPTPKDICDIVYKSLPYRLMSHTAEDLCEYFMPQEEVERCRHGDIRHGFIMEFPETPPKIDLVELEQKVNRMIEDSLQVCYFDDTHITIDGNMHLCTGPRTHVSSTGLIKGFRLLHHFIYDEFNDRYMMVGCVGENSDERLKQLDEKKMQTFISESDI